MQHFKFLSMLSKFMNQNTASAYIGNDKLIKRKCLMTLTMLFSIVTLQAQTDSFCPDFNSDGLVGASDFLTMLSVYGEPWEECSTPAVPQDSLYAIVFAESADDSQFGPDPDTDLLQYMFQELGGESAWYGFQAGSGVNGAYADGLAAYMDWPGWQSGTENNLLGALTSTVSTIDGGLDAYGNDRIAGSFETVKVPANTLRGNVWYSFWVPLVLLEAGGALPTNSLVNFDSSSCNLNSLNVESSLRQIDVIYTGPNWPNTTYRVFSGNGGFNQGASGVWDTTTNYFKGGG